MTELAKRQKKSKEMKTPGVVVKQTQEEPIAPEVIAQAIIRISDNMQKTLQAGLSRAAIVTLIRARGGVGKREVETVLSNLANLRRDWCTK
jgi:hypothetical protein